MKLRVFFVLIVAVLAGAVYLWLWPVGGANPAAVRHPLSDASVPARSTPPVGHPPVVTPEPEPTSPIQTASAVVPGQPMVRTTVSATPPPAAPVAAPAAAPSTLPPDIVDEKQGLENVRSMFRNYRTRMGENPVGSNAEIMKKVMGDNPVGAHLGPPEGQQINAEGELVDHWGTPYFFHQLAADKMEIRSAGPDHKMWTSDDVITK
jgi:hypothetical protein